MTFLTCTSGQCKDIGVLQPGSNSAAGGELAPLWVPLSMARLPPCAAQRILFSSQSPLEQVTNLGVLDEGMSRELALTV